MFVLLSGGSQSLSLKFLPMICIWLDLSYAEYQYLLKRNGNNLRLKPHNLVQFSQY
jgi:hypothetical protein